MLKAGLAAVCADAGLHLQVGSCNRLGDGRRVGLISQCNFVLAVALFACRRTYIVANLLMLVLTTRYMQE